MKNTKTEKPISPKRFMVAVASVALIMMLVYGVIIPQKIKSDAPKIIKYLESEGYSNIKLIDVKGRVYQATFSTNKGEIIVGYSNNGLFQIVY